MKRRKQPHKFYIVLCFALLILLICFISNKAENTSSIYQHFNFNQPLSLGIDVSEHQGKIDWQQVAQENIQFAIIRTGYGDQQSGNIDKYFYENIEEAKQNHIQVGAYHYSYALNEQQAIQEAQFVLKIIENIPFDLPIYFDFEDSCHDSLSNQELNNIVYAFIHELEKNGVKTGIYSHTSRLNQLNADLLQQDIWIASYGKAPNVSNMNIKIWQYSCEGHINGINTAVDLNYYY